MHAPSLAVREAYRECERYARRHSENFSVVTFLLPRKLRPHFFAVYAFCRFTDDLGDEADGDRLAMLDAWEHELREAVAGRPERPLFVALARTIEECSIALDPFLRLIEANRIDQRVSRFETYDDVLDYCSYSATPVGQMVLAVLGYHDAERIALSDQVCIGLQVANFWQDVSVDIRKGRVYVPQEDLRSFGCDDAQIVERALRRALPRADALPGGARAVTLLRRRAPRGPGLALGAHRHPALPPRRRGDPRRDRGRGL